MLQIALYEPEIPPNTGNIMRLAANAGAILHLIEPLGFDLSEKKLRRAGLDYVDWRRIQVHRNFAAFQQAVSGRRLFALTTRGRQSPDRVAFEDGDVLLFGPETRGLPQSLLDTLPRQHCLRLPMVPGSRSLNLSNAVAITLYEAWRQLGYPGARPVMDDPVS